MGLSESNTTDTRPFTVIRGVAYDLTNFLDRHPGGAHMLRQSIGRDATGLFESYHIRNEVSEKMLATLPRLPALPIPAEKGPFPNDSKIYRQIRDRLKKEVLRGKSQRGGIDHLVLIDFAIVAVSYALYLTTNQILFGVIMGAVCAHLGMTVNHCANHGGLSTNPNINFWLGFTNDFIGGSSLVWMYQHHVSHHIYVNSIHRDQDVFSAMPFVRFDKRLPKSWFHIYQHIYMGVLFIFLFIQKHISDLKAILKGKTSAVTMIGATQTDYVLAVIAKILHLLILLVVPLAVHGWAFIPTYLAFAMTGSTVLAWLFAISHNLEEAKTEEADQKNDWAVAQICHSANYGGAFEGLLTGGLNLQIEHHLFPALAYTWYPLLVPIVREECQKEGIRYNYYTNVFTMMGNFVQFMKIVGAEP